MITKIKYDRSSRPGLVLSRVWMGEPNAPFRLCGTIIMTEKEFSCFTKVLKDGALLGAGTVILCDEADGSSRNMPRVRL